MRETNQYEIISKFYDPLKWVVFGNHLIRAEKYFLDHIPYNSKILIIGGGSGQILTPILNSKKATTINYIDQSPAMISKARRKIKNHPKACLVNFQSEDFLKTKLNSNHDVVITNFFLDQFENVRLNEIMEKINDLTRKEALWLFADFDPGKIWWHKLITGIMFLFFKITTHIPIQRLPDWEIMFSQGNNWHKLNEKRFYGKLVTTRIYAKK